MNQIKYDVLVEILGEDSTHNIKELVEYDYFGIIDCGKAGWLDNFPIKTTDEVMEYLCSPMIDDNEGAVIVFRWDDELNTYLKGSLIWNRQTKDVEVKWASFLY